MNQNETPRRDRLDELWDEAKKVEMSDDERVEQRIIDVAASGNMADSRVTMDTTRAVHTLMKAEDAAS